MPTDRVLVISPHRDDAVLSVGQFMASHPHVVVATVCTAPPAGPSVQTEYDRNCGFAEARHAAEVREQEDVRALRTLGVIGRVDLGFVDSQYGAPLDHDALVEAIEQTAKEVDPAKVLGPLGLRHPDHQAVGYAALVADVGGAERWVYEELPYRVLWPEEVPARFDLLRTVGDPVLGFMGEGPLEAKRQAVGAYASQAWALNEHCLYVPERTHRMWCW